MNSTSLFAATIAFSCACSSGSAGPPGAVGPEGPQGPPGTQGSAGTTGSNGDPGAPGEAGATGAAGEAGTSRPAPSADAGTSGDKIVASIGCNGSLAGTPGYGFSYSADQFANGNVFAAGSVAGPSIGTSASTIYAPTQNGYVTAEVQFVLDAYAPADGGWWSIQLDRTSLVTTIVYHDADIVDAGSLTWTMQPSQCVVNRY